MVIEHECRCQPSECVDERTGAAWFVWHSRRAVERRILQAMIRAALVGLTLTLVAASAGGCGDDKPGERGSATIPAGLTRDEVYGRMEAALDADGDIVHVSVVVEEVDFGDDPTPEAFAYFDPEEYAEQLWLNARDEVVRVETRTRYRNAEEDRVSKAIVRTDGTFRVDGEGESNSVESLSCRGSESPLVAQLMRCGNYLEESTTSVESGEYDGRTAIVLVTEGELPSHDWTSPFENRLYIDPSSNLPVAADMRTSLPGDSTELNYRVQSRYDIELLDPSSLPGDFFEPSSIGYVERDPRGDLTATIDGMRVYWLGERYTPAASGAPLALQLGTSSPGRFPPGYRATLTYGLADDPYGPPVISLQEFPVDAWSQLRPDSGGHMWNSAGAAREEIEIPYGRATLFRLPSSYERYLAHVYFESTVILLGEHDEPSPYASREAFVELIKALRPYE